MTKGARMENKFARCAHLLGEDAMGKLALSRVAVFGIGGVGGYVCEALARSGVGAIDLFDDDVVSESNINRQIIATTKTIGKSKVEVMKERILDINPKAIVNAHQCFFMPETSHEFDFSSYDYVVDAIDTVTGKIEIIMRAKAAKVPVISVMGTGNKLDPTMLEVTDIYKTEVCPLARVMRREMKKRNVKRLKIVYSKEIPVIKGIENEDSKAEDRKGNPKTIVPGSCIFVPAAAGLIAAGEVIKDIIKGADIDDR